MLYTEDFKKQVVRKALEGSMTVTEIGQRLTVNTGSIHRWISLYRAEVQDSVKQINLGPLLACEPIDIEERLRNAERTELKINSGSAVLAQQLDQLCSLNKAISQYTDTDKYTVVMSYRAMPVEQQGRWLRQRGLQSSHINHWEETLITMSKQGIEHNDYTKQLEAENKLLKKQLTNLERDNRELKILIELKKKYPQLFQSDEAANDPPH